MSGVRIDKAGIRLDRKRTIDFRFNGRSYQGFAGDTLASAVLAAGDTVLSRSWKYHRPRAILTCRGVSKPMPACGWQAPRRAKTAQPSPSTTCPPS